MTWRVERAHGREGGRAVWLTRGEEPTGLLQGCEQRCLGAALTVRVSEGPPNL